MFSALAQQDRGDGASRRRFLHHASQLPHAANPLAVELHDGVALADAGLLGGTLGGDVLDDDAGCSGFRGLRIALLHVADRHADAAPPLSISSARTLGVTRVWPRTGGATAAAIATAVTATPMTTTVFHVFMNLSSAGVRTGGRGDARCVGKRPRPAQVQANR